MKQIASFQIDHNKLTPGMYLSRTDKQVVTYDIRFVKPNTPPFLEPAVMHTIEHLFATYVRNSLYSDCIVYFGPMGCRTGFYFLTQGLSHQKAIDLTIETLQFIAFYEGPIPGATAKECGNYLEQNLPGARKAAQEMVRILSGWTTDKLKYEV